MLQMRQSTFLFKRKCLQMSPVGVISSVGDSNKAATDHYQRKQQPEIKTFKALHSCVNCWPALGALSKLPGPVYILTQPYWGWSVHLPWWLSKWDLLMKYHYTPFKLWAMHASCILYLSVTVAVKAGKKRGYKCGRRTTEQRATDCKPTHAHWVSSSCIVEHCKYFTKKCPEGIHIWPVYI